MSEEKLKKAKEEGKAEAKKEAKAEARTKAKERDTRIRRIQKKTKRTEEDKAILQKEMVIRAQENKEAPRDLNKMYPSQMTLKEMESYCKKNGIEVKSGDSTVIIRARIKAFRNPAMADRVALLERIKVEGKIIR